MGGFESGGNVILLFLLFTVLSFILLFAWELLWGEAVRGRGGTEEDCIEL